MVRLLAEGMAAGYVRGRDPEVTFLVVSSAIAVPFGAKSFADAALPNARDALPAQLRKTILSILTVAENLRAQSARTKKIQGGTQWSEIWASCLSQGNIWNRRGSRSARLPKVGNHCDARAEKLIHCRQSVGRVAERNAVS